jgi:hypothetical protein|tara:strand:- start:210 stop:383 length:174 start_codon:yes stop_codon:yes gene_type:complete
MSKEFVNAVSTGNNVGAENVFKDAISAKVGDALEIKRKEVSKTFVGTQPKQEIKTDD